ncbi:MAG: ABC transporter substrate binding protein [Pseudomonadota bacterium]
MPARQVVIVFDEQSAIHRQVRAGLRLALDVPSGVGRVEFIDVPLDSVEKGARLDDADLVVTLGSLGARAVFAAAPEAPVLNALLPKQAFDLLRANGGPQPRRASVLYLDQPVERQLALARLVLPGGRSAGALAGSAVLARATEFSSAARSQGFDLELVEVGDGAPGAEAIRRVVHNNQLVVTLYDPAVLDASTAKWLLYLAYQERVPVIGLSDAYVKAGAAAAVFSTPEQIGRHVGERVVEFLTRGWQAVADPEPPRHYSVALNSSVARTLGLAERDEEKLLESLRATLGETP